MNEHRWISIFEQKPKAGTRVVVLLSSGNHTVAIFDGCFFCEDGLVVEDITHWISLPPSPPKRETLKVYNYEDLEEI